MIALGLYLFRNNFFVKIMIACGYNFRHYLSIIFNTLKTNGKFYVLSTVGVFGWLDTPMPTMFFCLVGIFMLILSMQDDNGESICKIKWYHRGVCFLVFCLMTVFLITALLSWNFTLNGLDVYLLSLDDFVKGIQGISVALGIQGRYFIPMVFFLTIPLHGIINIKKSYLMILQFMYYSVMSIWTINILLQRFWY